MESIQVWYSYIAGFFDGEGSVSIVRNRANGYSDYHKIVITLSQRAKHRLVLDYIAEEFGGTVAIRNQPTRIAQAWAEQAVWQLQDKPSQERFLTAIQPYVLVKAEPVRIGLEFLRTFRAPTPVRDALGRIQGKSLSAEEIERREALRLALREANELGPHRVPPSTLPPLDLRHRQRALEEVVSNPATIERGTQRYNAKLTDDDVRAIRTAFTVGGVTKHFLAQQYGVSDMVIGGIIRGTRWGHVT